MKRVVVIALLLFCWVLPANALADDERVVILGDVLVDRGETTGDIFVADGDVTVRGTVDGNIFVGDGDVTIRGTVTGDVFTAAGTATLGRRAHVEGDLNYGDKEPQVASGAQVDGDIEKFKPEDLGGGAIALQIGVWVAFTVSLLLFGIILLLLFPRAADAVARSGKGKSLLVGLVAIIVIPIIAVVSLVTIIGIPLGLVLLLLLAPLWAIGYSAGAFMVGRLVSKKGARILAFVIGLLILRVIALIPFLGGLVSFLAALMGIGALLIAAQRARK
ncbi:MAG TPA: polymer-forming cytoskeletal protein [Solirubrobacteraceae bacterium]|nr:polymer-forming cytoskeletal protein [Solirubrobacteraceae bacterium]